MPSKRAKGPSPFQYCSLLELANFRGFGRRQIVPLKPLTFVVGPNSSGKTSLGHALFLFAQSGMATATTRPIWNGPLADLGSFRDNVFRNDPAKTIALALEFRNVGEPGRRRSPSARAVRIDRELHGQDDDSTGYISYFAYSLPGLGPRIDVRRRRGRYPSYTITLGRRSTTWKPGIRAAWQDDSLPREIWGLMYERRGNSRISHLRDLFEHLHFNPHAVRVERVSSARAAPQRWYSTQVTADRSAHTSTPPLIQSFHPDMLSPREHGPEYQSRLRAYLNAGLRRLNIGDSISTKHLSPYHDALIVRDNIIGNRANLMDVGYGASQALPILWSLANLTRSMLVLEQPEVHLHPRAQGELGDDITHAATHRQIIVETHSEHLINRARLQVARGDFRHEDMIVIYVDRDRKGSYVTPITVDQHGNFDRPWPDGFFDERYRDTMKLATLAAEPRHGRRT